MTCEYKIIGLKIYGNMSYYTIYILTYMLCFGRFSYSLVNIFTVLTYSYSYNSILLFYTYIFPYCFKVEKPAQFKV